MKSQKSSNWSITQITLKRFPSNTINDKLLYLSDIYLNHMSTGLRSVKFGWSPRGKFRHRRELLNVFCLSSIDVQETLIKSNSWESLLRKLCSGSYLPFTWQKHFLLPNICFKSLQLEAPANYSYYLNCSGIFLERFRLVKL